MNELEKNQGQFALGMYEGNDESIDVTYSYRIVDQKLLTHGTEMFEGVEAAYDDLEEFEFEEHVSEDHKLYYLLAATSGIACASTQGVVGMMVGASSKALKSFKGIEEKELPKILQTLNVFGGNEKTVSDLIRKVLKKTDTWSDFVLDELMAGKLEELEGVEISASYLGLLASLAEQFYGAKVVIRFSEKKGFYLKFVSRKKKSGTNYIGKGIQEKLFFGIINWMVGSAMNLGTKSVDDLVENGLPRKLAEMICDLAKCPQIEAMKEAYKNDNTKVAEWMLDLLKSRNITFSLRSELQLTSDVVKQVLPVCFNEIFTRCTYMVLRFIEESKRMSFEEMKENSFAGILPTTKDNRLLIRMLTISSGVFVSTDLVRAAILAQFKGGSFASFVENINIVGVGRFGFAVAVDAEYIVQDLKKLFEKKVKSEKMARDDSLEVVDLESTLPMEQYRVLLNLEYWMVQYDIRSDLQRSEIAKKKASWLASWKALKEEQFEAIKKLGPVSFEVLFLEKEKDLYTYIETLVDTSGDDRWVKTVVLFALFFKPYEPLGDAEVEEVKKFALPFKKEKDLVSSAKYNPLAYMPTFGTRQSYVIEAEANHLYEVYNSYYDKVSGNKMNKIKQVVTTSVAVAGAGAAAAVFAPAIAVIGVGACGGGAGLAGAALVNHCLATVGGGAIAAGGFGMAGGTAIIAGSGAMIGLVGGGLVSGATFKLAVMKEDFLKMWCEFLTLAKLEYVHQEGGIERISKMRDDMELIESKVQYDIQIQKDSLAEGRFETSEQKNSQKVLLKQCEDMLVYITNTKKELNGLISA